MKHLWSEKIRQLNAAERIDNPEMKRRSRTHLVLGIEMPQGEYSGKRCVSIERRSAMFVSWHSEIE